MPKPLSSEELVLKMQALPGTLRDFLASPDVVESIEEIQKTYALTDQTAIALSRAIAWYVAGFLNASELGSELAKIAPQGKLADLRSDVIKKIFTPFASQLHAHGLNFESIIIGETPTLATPKPALPPSPSKPEEKPSPQPAKTEGPPAIVIGETPKPTPPPQVITPPPVVPPPPSQPKPQPITPPVEPLPKLPTSEIPATKPTGLPRITITKEQPGVPTVTEEEKKEKEPEPMPRPIRYTPPPVISEVPKIISPTPITPKAIPPTPPSVPSPQVPPSAPKVDVESKKPAPTPVIDLSTFQITQNPPSSNANPGQPKGKGNVIDLKG
jgi:hypothetical protein